MTFRTLFSVPLSTRSGLVRIPVRWLEEGKWKGQLSLQIYWTLLGYGVFFGQNQQIIIFPLYILTTFAPNQLTIQTRIYFWACYSVTQVYMSVFLLAPYCFNHSQSLCNILAIRDYDASNFLLYQDCYDQEPFLPSARQLILSLHRHSSHLHFICSSSHSTRYLPCVIYLTNVSWVPTESPTLRQHASSEPTHSITMSPKAHHSLLYGGSVTLEGLLSQTHSAPLVGPPLRSSLPSSPTLLPLLLSLTPNWRLWIPSDCVLDGCLVCFHLLAAVYLSVYSISFLNLAYFSLFLYLT